MVVGGVNESFSLANARLTRAVVNYPESVGVSTDREAAARASSWWSRLDVRLGPGQFGALMCPDRLLIRVLAQCVCVSVCVCVCVCVLA